MSVQMRAVRDLLRLLVRSYVRAICILLLLYVSVQLGIAILGQLLAIVGLSGAPICHLICRMEKREDLEPSVRRDSMLLDGAGRGQLH
jgi:hypothetical protein